MRLIVIGGFAGAGKTTVAARLAKEQNLPLFCSDDYIETIRCSQGLGFHEAAPIAYETLWIDIRRHLAAGASVVLDANMCHARTWQSVDEIKNDLPRLTVTAIVLDCPLDICRQRIEKRGQENLEHNNLGGDAFEDIVYKHDFISQLQRTDILRIDSSGSLEVVYATCNAALTEAEDGNPHNAQG